MLEVSSADSAEGRIDFLGQSCDPTVDRESFQYRSRYAERLELAIVQSGRYSACITAQDPEAPLGRYKLQSLFLPSKLEKEEDPDEHEPDPDPFACFGFQKEEDPDEHEPDPDPFACFGFQKEEDPDEHEPDPDPIVSAPNAERIQGACLSARTEYSDTLMCATNLDLGTPLNAEIHNSWGDDQDVFTFVIDELTTVRLSIVGERVSGVLTDEAGHRLSLIELHDRGPGLHAVKTLSAGRYFVEITGVDGGESDYRVVVEEIESTTR